MKAPIKLKTPNQIKLLRISATAISQWLNACCPLLEQGILKSGCEVERYFENYVKSLKNKEDWTFPFASQPNLSGEHFGSKLCISINDVVAHCRPVPDLFNIGDVITIDAGLSYRGWCSDVAATIIFGSKTTTCTTYDIFDKVYLISGVNIAIERALEVCKPGNKIESIAREIYRTAQEFALGNITSFMGHGIGQKLHEPPLIPSDPFYNPQASAVLIRPGMVLCLEPMFTLGNSDIVIDTDGWTIFTSDGSLSAHCEVEVLVTKDGNELLTQIPKIFS